MTDERTILCYGDSNTHGTMPMEGPDDMGRFPRGARWPDVLGKALGRGWCVIDEGHPGRTTVHPDPIEGGNKSGIDALLPILESHRPLDLVVIMLGTNDLKGRMSLSPSDIAGGIERLVIATQGSACGPRGGAPAVMIVSPAPIVEAGFLADMFRGGAAKSRQLAAALEPLAARLGVAFWDAGKVAEVDPDEGIHLTEAAHAALGNALAAEVRGLLT